jgi:hypothetical protein
MNKRFFQGNFKNFSIFNEKFFQILINFFLSFNKTFRNTNILNIINFQDCIEIDMIFTKLTGSNA